jgi:hypothetical protein
MKSLVVGLIVVLSLMNGRAEAQHAVALGPGANLSCGSWTENRRERNIDAGLEESWLLGLLTGFSFAPGEHHILTGQNALGIFGWMDEYCLRHPRDMFQDAVVAFIRTRPL